MGHRVTWCGEAVLCFSGWSGEADGRMFEQKFKDMKEQVMQKMGARATLAESKYKRPTKRGGLAWPLRLEDGSKGGNVGGAEKIGSKAVMRLHRPWRLILFWVWWEAIEDLHFYRIGVTRVQERTWSLGGSCRVQVRDDGCMDQGGSRGNRTEPKDFLMDWTWSLPEREKPG